MLSKTQKIIGTIRGNTNNRADNRADSIIGDKTGSRAYGKIGCKQKITGTIGGNTNNRADSIMATKPAAEPTAKSAANANQAGEFSKITVAAATVRVAAAAIVLSGTERPAPYPISLKSDYLSFYHSYTSSKSSTYRVDPSPPLK